MDELGTVTNEESETLRDVKNEVGEEMSGRACAVKHWNVEEDSRTSNRRRDKEYMEDVLSFESRKI